MTQNGALAMVQLEMLTDTPSANIVRQMRTILLSAVLVLAFLFLTRSFSQSNSYNFVTLNVDFPSFHDDLFGCAATDLNDYRVIVGGCNDLSQNSDFRGYLYDGRRFREIDFHHVDTGPRGGGANQGLLIARSVYQSRPFQSLGSTKQIVSGVNPQGINNQEHLTGWYFDLGGTRLHGFLKRNGDVLALTVPNSQLLTEAVGINEFDQVVGDYRGQDGAFHGFRYAEGNYVSFDFPSAPDTGASGINNRGQIVGCYSLCSHGFLSDPTFSTFTTIDIPGALATQARDINDLGQIIGVYSTDNITAHGFLYDAQGFRSIDAPGAFITTPFGINNQGQIVGYFVIQKSPSVFEHHAFLVTR